MGAPIHMFHDFSSTWSFVSISYSLLHRISKWLLKLYDFNELTDIYTPKYWYTVKFIISNSHILKIHISKKKCVFKS